MQIVIDIPESILNTIQADEMISREQLAVLQMHILNGTPLPKGHGRIGDLDALREEVSSWGMNDYEPSDFTDAIDDAPTVEAIPKADYENRLKADLVATLTELQLEIEELEPLCNECDYAIDDCTSKAKVNNIIQQKINSLKEGADGENNN